MQIFSRHGDVDNALVLVGLVLVEASVYQWFGLPATLAYAGTMLVVVAMLLMLERDER